MIALFVYSIFYFINKTVKNATLIDVAVSKCKSTEKYEAHPRGLGCIKFINTIHRVLVCTVGPN